MIRIVCHFSVKDQIVRDSYLQLYETVSCSTNVVLPIIFRNCFITCEFRK